MWTEGELEYGYPFALDLFIDGYEGPIRFRKFFLRQSGWLKAVRVRLETPVQTWSETLFACITDEGFTLKSFPSSFLTAMPTSSPMEVEHLPPEDDLDELIDGYYWDFLGRCDRYCQRILDQAHADADLIVRQHEKALERLNRQIDGKLKVIRRLLRDHSRRTEWPDLENKKARLKHMAEQLPPIFLERMRKARRAVDEVEELALSSMGYEGELEELFTVYFRVRDRNESPRVHLRWQRSARTHQVPWEDERKALVRELESTTSYVPNRDRHLPMLWNGDGKAPAFRPRPKQPSVTKQREMFRENITAEIADKWFKGDGGEDQLDEEMLFSANDGDDDVISDESFHQRQLADAEKELAADDARKTVSPENEPELLDEDTFRRLLERDAARELKLHAERKLQFVRDQICGPFSLRRPKDKFAAEQMVWLCETFGEEPDAMQSHRMDADGELYKPGDEAAPPEAVEIDPLIIAFVHDMMKLRSQRMV